MKKTALSPVMRTLFIVFVFTSCKDKDNSVTPTIAPTGLTIFINGTTNPFIVYGGSISKSDTNAAEHIRTSPENNGFTVLDTATTTTTIQGAYEYYLILPAELKTVEIDAIKLLGPNKYYSGAFNEPPSGGPLTVYGSCVQDGDKINGAPDQQSAKIMAGTVNGTTWLTPFMLFPGNYWY